MCSERLVWNQNTCLVSIKRVIVIHHITSGTATYKKCVEISVSTALHGYYCISGVTACGNGTSCIESICQCNSTIQYWDGSACTSKKTYQGSCTNVSASGCLSTNECEQCSQVSGLICNSTTSTCLCSSTYYYDTVSLKCVTPKAYYESCSCHTSM